MCVYVKKYIYYLEWKDMKKKIMELKLVIVVYIIWVLFFYSVLSLLWDMLSFMRYFVWKWEGKNMCGYVFYCNSFSCGR